MQNKEEEEENLNLIIFIVSKYKTSRCRWKRL